MQRHGHFARIGCPDRSREPARPPCQGRRYAQPWQPDARRCRRRDRGRLGLPQGFGCFSPIYAKLRCILYNARRGAHCSARLLLLRLAPLRGVPSGLPPYKIRVLRNRGQFLGSAGYTRARVHRPPSPHPTALRSGGRVPFGAFRYINPGTLAGFRG